MQNTYSKGRGMHFKLISVYSTQVFIKIKCFLKKYSMSFSWWNFGGIFQSDLNLLIFFITISHKLTIFPLSPTKIAPPLCIPRWTRVQMKFIIHKTAYQIHTAAGMRISPEERKFPAKRTFAHPKFPVEEGHTRALSGPDGGQTSMATVRGGHPFSRGIKMCMSN